MITISSNSMDELNTVFKKLRLNYKAVNPIKIDPDELIYKLEIEKRNLSPMVKNVVDKAIEHCEDLAKLKSISLSGLEAFILEHKENCIVSRQLDDLYQHLDRSTRIQVVEYIALELSLSLAETDHRMEAA